MKVWKISFFNYGELNIHLFIGKHSEDHHMITQQIKNTLIVIIKFISCIFLEGQISSLTKLKKCDLIFLKRKKALSHQFRNELTPNY